MALRRILRIDDPTDNVVLKTPCRSVHLPNPSLKQLVADMFETMRAANGVGIAAPQIGITQRLAVIEISHQESDQDGQENDNPPTVEQYILVNPVIVKASREQTTILDGCLSLPGWYGEVARAAWVTVDYQDLNGKRYRLRKATGLLSYALQHEIDHLNGVLYTQHIRDLSTLRFYGTREREAS